MNFCDIFSVKKVFQAADVGMLSHPSGSVLAIRLRDIRLRAIGLHAMRHRAIRLRAIRLHAICVHVGRISMRIALKEVHTKTPVCLFLCSSLTKLAMFLW